MGVAGDGVEGSVGLHTVDEVVAVAVLADDEVAPGRGDDVVAHVEDRRGRAFKDEAKDAGGAALIACSFRRARLITPDLAALRRAAVLGPSEPEALNYLGYTLAERGRDLDEAFQLLRDAVALAPTSGAVVDSYGWAYFQLGRYDDAVGQLETAVGLDPTSPVITDHLGDVYWRLGREREARFEWRRALELDPEPELEIVLRDKLADGLAPREP